MTDFRPMSKRMVDARPEEVDQVIGKRRVSAVSTTVDWSECGLAKRFPAWEAFLESLAVERVTAK